MKLSKSGALAISVVLGIIITVLTGSNLFLQAYLNSHYSGGATCGAITRQPQPLPSISGGFPATWVTDRPYDYGCTLAHNALSYSALGFGLDLALWFVIATTLLFAVKRFKKK